MQMSKMRDSASLTDVVYEVVDWVAYQAKVSPKAIATRELPSG